MKQKVFKAIGIAGTLACIVVYTLNPSFPTPDKLLVFAIFASMIFSQAIELAKRFGPFVGLILIYESFRGVADNLNSRVNFDFMIDMDTLLFFGTLPTRWLQDHLWNGQLQWYDFTYFVYLLHFVFPFVLAVVIWRKFEAQYWNYMWTFVVLMFAGFLTYILFPAAPPWMASDLGYIEPVQRISSEVWFALGIQDFPSLYNEIAPNPVAAVPSLHAAFAFLFAFFVGRLFKTNWKYLAWLYPGLIVFVTVYMAEHYVIDAFLGLLYAIAAFKFTPFITKYFAKLASRANLRKLTIKQI